MYEICWKEDILLYSTKKKILSRIEEFIQSNDITNIQLIEIKLSLLHRPTIYIYSKDLFKRINMLNLHLREDIVVDIKLRKW